MELGAESLLAMLRDPDSDEAYVGAMVIACLAVTMVKAYSKSG